MADAKDLKSFGISTVWVRLPPALWNFKKRAALLPLFGLIGNG